MRIAAFPKAFLQAMLVTRTMTVYEWIDLARVLPVEGLELHTGFFWEGTSSELDRVGEELAAASFEMPMLCASPDFTHPDADQRSRELEEQVSALRVAAHLGGDRPTCRVLSGQAHPGVPLEQGLDWAAEAIRAVIAIGEELGVTICLENHYKASTWQYPEFAQHPEVFRALLARLPVTAGFGVQFDPSNALTAGVDAAEFLATVVDRVYTMQASDRHLVNGATLDSLRQANGTLGYSPDLRHGVLGQGLNDFDSIFTQLAVAGYDGWVSIEDGVNGMAEMVASAEFLRQARERYFGGSTDVRVAAQDRLRPPP
jgi:sugar phosphate isomerase/epimerase